jgi:hypothetical protein
VPIGVTTVNPSYATLVALASAPLAGLLVQWIRLIGLSDRPGLAGIVLWKSKADIATIALYDICGAAIVVASVIILGITRPPSLVHGFQTSPLVAWGIVGLSGPLFSIGVLDRLPVHAFADLVTRSEETRDTTLIAAMLTQVRARASTRVAETLWAESTKLEDRERHGLLVRAKQLAASDVLTFHDVARALRDHATKLKRPLPEEVEDILDLPAKWGHEANPDRHTPVAVGTALDFGLCVPIATACDCAEQRLADSIQQPDLSKHSSTSDQSRTAEVVD